MAAGQTDSEDRKRWDAFIVASPGSSFLQSWAWGELQRDLSVSYWRLAGEGWRALVVKRELPLGQSWLYVPRGPVFEEEGVSNKEKAFSQLRDWVTRERAMFVRVEPPWGQDETPSDSPLSGGGTRWCKAPRDVQPRHTVVVDLDRAEEELLAGMRAKTRYNVRLAQRRGVTVRWSRDEADLDHFLRLVGEVERRGAFHYHSADYYQAMLRVLTPSNSPLSGGGTTAELAVAEHDGDVLAVHVLVAFGDTATYLHGASGGKRHLMAPHLLQWESMRRAKARGFLHYDFWGVAPPGAGSRHPWAGITRFKEGFGGRRVEYPGAYDLVWQPVRYGVFNALRRVLR